ncbi:MAG: hypothetical protein ACREJD_16815 [Phycisphaerales bacterium]
MDAGEIHILGAWSGVQPRDASTDSAVLACVERLLARDNQSDRVVLVADDHGERRAAALGLQTPLVVPPALLRGSRFRNGLVRTLSRLDPRSRLVCWNDALIERVRPVADSIWKSPLDTVDGRDSEQQALRVPAGNRRAIRSELGVPEDEHVMILAADPPDAFSAQDFIRACALVGLVGRDVTAIVPRQAPEMERAKATLRNSGIPIRLMTSEAPMWTLLPCADSAVLEVVEGAVPRSAPAHSKRWLAMTCARLGIPVVWPEAESLGSARLDRWVLRPRSRLAVNVARVINEHVLASDATLLEPKGEHREVVA